MKLSDLIQIYEDKKKRYGDKVYLHISEIFEEAREEYKREYLASPKAKKLLASGKSPDPEQSWKAFKGKNFEKLVLHAIRGELETMGLGFIPGNVLVRRKKLSSELDKVYRNLLVRYGPFALLPDIDLVLFKPTTLEVIGVVSCKITLRERIAQTAYWKLKLASNPMTAHIKGYFVTADEDGDLIQGLTNPHRNRIIVEYELDGTYTLRKVAESDKVKAFPQFIEDLRKMINRGVRHG